MLIFTTNNRAICMSNSEWRHCETLLSYYWTHWTSPRGWMPPSWISPITAQRRSAYVNDSFHYVTKGAESEQLVRVLFYQRKCVFYNMEPLRNVVSSSSYSHSILQPGKHQQNVLMFSFFYIASVFCCWHGFFSGADDQSCFAGASASF